MRVLFSTLLILTLMLTACGGGSDSNGEEESSGDGSVLPAGIGGSSSTDNSGSSTAESDADQEDSSVAGGTETEAPTATLTRRIVQPTNTPRPTSTPFPTATQIVLPPTATAAPDAKVEIISTNIFRDPAAGSAIIFGEVQNTGDVPATGVEVQASLFNANGDRVGRGESESVGKTVMNPGDLAGFSIIISFVDGQYVEWTSEEIVADYNFTRFDVIEAYTDQLSITNDTLLPPATGFDFVDIAGNLTNDTGETLRFVQVGAIAYDAAGNVISVDSYVSTDPVEPGATIPFAVEFSRGRLKDFPASYVLVVEGLAQE